MSALQFSFLINKPKYVLKIVKYKSIIPTQFSLVLLNQKLFCTAESRIAKIIT